MTDDSSYLNINIPHNNAARSLSNLSNLEKNCNQIFIKGPAITKDFFDKIQNEVVPQKTDLFGYQMNTRRLILLTGLILLFTFSTMGTITMWFTDSYQKHINSKMVISEDSIGYNMWKSPAVSACVKIYIFNYTNVHDFEDGKAKKLHVEQVGPYVYFEQVEKVNIRFNKVDGTVSYQEKRTYRFSEELSKGTKDDLVIVPNIPLLAGASVAKNQFNFILRMSYSGLLKTLSQKPFKTLRADDFISGYNDDLYDLSKNYLKLQDIRTFDYFGLFAWKAGLQPDVFTMNTGAHDITQLGQIEKFNGESQFDFWGSDSCNNIRSSDGIMYSPNLLKAKNDLYFFVPQLCRTLSLQFVKETTVLEKVPAYRYKMPLDIFDSAQDNRCYCSKQNGVCPLRGVFNATLCSFGAPIFYSWPYFYKADPSFKNAVTGLKKTPNLNDTYVDLHAKIGMLMQGKVKIQVNIQLRKSFGISQLNAYPDNLMLPMVWLETGLEGKDLPAGVTDLIYQVTFTVKNVELGLKYGCLLATMVTLTSILLVLKKHRQGRLRADSLRRPMDLEH